MNYVFKKSNFYLNIKQIFRNFNINYLFCIIKVLKKILFKKEKSWIKKNQKARSRKPKKSSLIRFF